MYLTTFVIVHASMTTVAKWAPAARRRSASFLPGDVDLDLNLDLDLDLDLDVDSAHSAQGALENMWSTRPSKSKPKSRSTFLATTAMAEIAIG
jgi:hypothetical protein